MFESNRYCYAEYEHDDNVKLIYQTPPLEYACIDVKGNNNFSHELENQRRRWQDCISEKNHAVPDIIPLTEDNDTRPPTGAPTSENKPSVDSSLGNQPT